MLRTENEIISNWKGDKKKPLVSVCCTAYNHESYIEDAIKGFLIQETDFPFEILIHDDASTDNTANIIREYEKLYPNIIKVIYQTENQYSQGKRPFALLYSLSKARYIAVCEGDDYWCDKRKLAIQVAYLEKHPEVVISSHDAKVIDIDGNVIKESKLPLSQHRDHSSEELILGNYGSSHHHSDIKPSAYRVHGGGVWSSINDDEKIDAQINSWYWIYKYYSRIGKVKYAKAWWRKYLTLVLKKSNVKDVIISILANSLPTSIKKVIKSILLNK